MKRWALLAIIFITAGCNLSSSKDEGNVVEISPILTQFVAPTATQTNIPTPTVTPTPTQFPWDEPGLIVTLGKIASPSWRGIPVFSPDGQTIALVDTRIRFWDVFSHQLVLNIENAYPVSCTHKEVKFSPDGRYFAVNLGSCPKDENSDGKLMIWETSTGKLIQEWSHEHANMPGPEGRDFDYIIPVYAFAFLPNSTGVIFASGHTLITRDLLHDEVLEVIDLGAEMYATEISLSSDGSLVYIIMSWMKDHDWPINWTYKYKFQIWDIGTQSLVQDSNYPEGWVTMDLRLLGPRLVYVDLEQATSLITYLETDEVRDYPFRRGWRYYNSDGNLMIAVRFFGFGDEKKVIELWNTDNWRNIYTFMPDLGKDWFYGMHGIAFSPDNTILAIAHQEQITLWNIGPVVNP